jgi:hypothetical protein
VVNGATPLRGSLTKGVALRKLSLLLAALLATPLAAGEPKTPPYINYQNPYYRPKPPPPPPRRPPAPDMCGPGYYCDGPCGMIYGPNYCVRPCFPPFNGLLPTPATKQPRTQEEYQEMLRQQQLRGMAPPRPGGYAYQGLPPLPATPGAGPKGGYPNLRPGAAPPGPYPPPTPGAPPGAPPGALPPGCPPGYPPPAVGPGGIASFPVNPFIRSPRDFFMVGDP